MSDIRRERDISEPICAAYKQYMQDNRKGPYDIDAFADAIEVMIENAIIAYDDHEKAERGFGPMDIGYRNPNVDAIGEWSRIYITGEH